MSAKKTWLDALKKTIQEEPRPPREDSVKPTVTNMQNVRKLREAGGEVLDLNAARVHHTEDESRLLAPGWTPKERCGPKDLTIWANPETGFYFSREIALHHLEVSKNVEG